MKWNALTSVKQVEELIESSKEKTIMIFKHSTRCPVSSGAYGHMDANWKEEEMGAVMPFLLLVVENREVSNLVEKQFDIEHKSPQLLLIKEGKCEYDTSHFHIRYDSLKEQLGL